MSKLTTLFPIVCLIMVDLPLFVTVQGANKGAADQQDSSTTSPCPTPLGLRTDNYDSDDIVSPALPGTAFYHLGSCERVRVGRHVGIQSRSNLSSGAGRKKRSHGEGLVHIDDCDKGKYPVMCDYYPNRIPAKITMYDCKQCNSDGNQGLFISYCELKGTTGNWRPTTLILSLPFRSTADNVYYLRGQKIDVGCYCDID